MKFVFAYAFADTGLLYPLLHSCILGAQKDPLRDAELGDAGKSESVASRCPSPVPNSKEDPPFKYFTKLVLAIVGLQVTYLTWGVLQERVMTRTYDGDKFTNSQFLVLVNRVLALIVVATYLSFSRQKELTVPFYKYSFSSLSNIISSWCQYEALKFVSYPTQVLAKSSKVIPVMLMGKVVSNRTYKVDEYITALMLSGGIGLFLLAADPAGQKHSTETTVAGIVILLGYMVFDSFTSNWQSELFQQYQMSAVQMMFGINTFSCLFTMTSLFLQGQLFGSLRFLFGHWEFAFHAMVLSFCSALGQLFIYHTIQVFGPLVFTLIMTTRQAISILLSCILYGHVLTVQALVGVAIVFVSLFLRVYLKQRSKPKTEQSNNAPK